MTYGKYESEQTIPELCRTNNAERQTNVTLWRRETRIDCLGLHRRSAARRHHRNRQLFSLRKRHREAEREARQRRGTLFCGRRRPSERATAMDGRGRTLNEFLMPCNFARGRQRRFCRSATGAAKLAVARDTSTVLSLHVCSV